MIAIVDGCRFGTLIGAALVLMLPATVRADDVKLVLRVTSGERKVQTKVTRQEPSSQKPQPQPVFRAAPGESLKVAWEARHDDGKTTFKDVLVHFFVVPEKKVGQIAIPPLGKDVPHEGAVTLDFKPDAEASGEFTIQLDQPGSYMIRVETRGLLGQVQHEDYTAMDLVIE